MNLSKQIPILSWMPNYRMEWLRFDIMAGLTCAAVVLPKAMAISVIAGLPVQTGLYTALVAMMAYAIFGTSRALSVSTTATLAMMTAAELVIIREIYPGIEAGTVAATLAFLIGLFLVAARLLRCGFIANFFSTPVLVGFQAGIGVAIFSGQLGSVLGVHFASTSTVGILKELPGALGHVHGLTVWIGLACIGLLLGLPRLAKRIPEALIVVVLCIIASAVFGLVNRGVDIVGAMPAGLPSFSLPNFSLLGLLWPGALGIALMTASESIAVGRSTACPKDAPVDANQELFAIGAANIAASFVGGMPSGGGVTQTAVNDRAGARSQMAEIVTAVMAAVILLFLSEYIGLLPKATLGAVLVVAALHLFKPWEFRAVARVRKDELLWAITAMIGVILFGSLNGIIIAILVSLATLLYHANNMPVRVLAYDPEQDFFGPVDKLEKGQMLPGLLVVRLEGTLFFASVPKVKEKLDSLIGEEAPRVVVLDFVSVPDIEYTALDMLIQSDRNLAERGINLWFASLSPKTQEIMERSPFWAQLGDGRVYPSVRKAVKAFRRSIQ